MSSVSCAKRLPSTIDKYICLIVVSFTDVHMRRFSAFCYLFPQFYFAYRLSRSGHVDLTVSTPINIPRLASELQSQSDRSFVTFLLAGLQSGFHTGIQQIPKCTHQGENLRSARKYPDIVSKLLKEEVDNGFLWGPYSSSPFPVHRISPLGFAFGKYCEKPRLILDLSWPHDPSHISSINDLIDKRRMFFDVCHD